MSFLLRIKPSAVQDCAPRDIGDSIPYHYHMEAFIFQVGDNRIPLIDGPDEGKGLEVYRPELDSGHLESGDVGVHKVPWRTQNVDFYSPSKA